MAKFDCRRLYSAAGGVPEPANNRRTLPLFQGMRISADQLSCDRGDQQPRIVLGHVALVRNRVRREHTDRLAVGNIRELPKPREKPVFSRGIRPNSG